MYSHVFPEGESLFFTLETTFLIANNVYNPSDFKLMLLYPLYEFNDQHISLILRNYQFLSIQTNTLTQQNLCTAFIFLYKS